jgi:choline dehydrogenase-like flavoprotein
MSRSWDTPERQAEGKMFVFNNRGLPKIEFEKYMIDGKSRDDIDDIIRGQSQAGLSAFIEEFGNFNNQLTLARGTGRYDLPKMQIRFSRPDSLKFMETVEDAQDALFECLRHLGYRREKTRIEDPRGDHASGACRMGIGPDSSVTDKNLAVHGIDNLFVCSNAVLPNAAAVNPTLTLAALALRLGSHLGEGKL